MMRWKRKASVVRAAAVALVTAASSACATKSDIRDLHDEILALAALQDSLMGQLRFETLSTQDTLRTQSDQLFDFRGDIARQLQAIMQGLQRLEALTGENQRGIASVRDQLANQRASGPTVTLPAAGGDTTAPGGGGAETVAGAGGNADQLWGVARDQHQRGSLSTAQRAYDQFVREHPNDPRAPDARWFMADILVQQDRPEDALEAYEEIQRLWPTHARVPDALLRIGLLQRDLGDTDDARATLERLINSYPESSSAQLARIFLDEIG